MSVSGRVRAGAAWLAAMAASAAVVALFFKPFLARNPLTAFDWPVNGTYYEWIRTAFTEYAAYPLYMAGAPQSFNLIANPQSPVLSPFVWLLIFLPAGTYLGVLLVAYAAAGLLGMIALLREHGVGWEVAGFAGGEVESIAGKVGVRVEPGAHEVSFRYVPRFFPLGLALSALTLLAGIVRRRQARPKASSSGR